MKGTNLSTELEQRTKSWLPWTLYSRWQKHDEQVKKYIVLLVEVSAVKKNGVGDFLSREQSRLLLCSPPPMATSKLQLNYRTITLENHLKTS